MVEEEAVAIVPANEPVIRNLIYAVRGTQVMLDSDLALLYEVETGNLNKAAGGNAERFPDELRFKLTSEERSDLLFQIGRAKPEGRGGRRTPPLRTPSRERQCSRRFSEARPQCASAFR